MKINVCADIKMTMCTYIIIFKKGTFYAMTFLNKIKLSN